MENLDSKALRRNSGGYRHDFNRQIFCVPQKDKAMNIQINFIKSKRHHLENK